MPTIFPEWAVWKCKNGMYKMNVTKRAIFCYVFVNVKQLINYRADLRYNINVQLPIITECECLH